MSGESHHRFDECALEFLGSEFASRIYTQWPIERRLEAFLRRQGLSHLADAGEYFNDLMDRVMVNFARARQDGLVSRTAHADGGTES
jgi:hypothetical protein